MNDEIIKDVGGVLVLDAAQLARPSAAFVTLYKPGAVELVAEAAATIDAATQALTSTSSSGSTTIHLSDSSDFVVGRRYVITADDGRSEWVRVVANNQSTDKLTIAGELAFDYANTTSTIFSTRMTATISAANAATLDEGYEARWRYTVDSVEQRINTGFDVVRSAWMDVAIPAYEFKLVAGDLASSDFEDIERGGLDFADEIAEAVAKVRREVSARGYRPALFRTVSVFNEAVCQRLLLTSAERGENVPSAWQDDIAGWLDLRREVYDQVLTVALNAQANYDADESGDVSDIERDARLGSMRIVL